MVSQFLIQLVFHLPNKHLSFTLCVFVQQEWTSESWAIVETKNPPTYTCISPIGVVPKQGGKSCLIVDLRKINNLCFVPKFQCDDISVVAEYIQPCDFMVTLDFKSGFHHIHVWAEHQQFLGIAFRGHFYTWRVLPFGLSCSPYFCKTLRPCSYFFPVYQRFESVCLCWWFASPCKERLYSATYRSHGVNPSEIRMVDKHEQIVSCSQDVKEIHWVQNRATGASSVKSAKLPCAKITKGQKNIY